MLKPCWSCFLSPVKSTNLSRVKPKVVVGTQNRHWVETKCSRSSRLLPRCCFWRHRSERLLIHHPWRSQRGRGPKSAAFVCQLCRAGPRWRCCLQRTASSASSRQRNSSATRWRTRRGAPETSASPRWTNSSEVTLSQLQRWQLCTEHIWKSYVPDVCFRVQEYSRSWAGAEVRSGEQYAGISPLAHQTHRVHVSGKSTLPPVALFLFFVF